MLRYLISTLLCIALMVLQIPVCYCDGQVTSNQEEWNPPSAGPITTWTAPLCGKGKIVVQPFFFYNNTRGFFDPDGHYESLPNGDWKYQFQEQLFAQLGLTDRLEIDGQTVYQQNILSKTMQKHIQAGLVIAIFSCVIVHLKREIGCLI